MMNKLPLLAAAALTLGSACAPAADLSGSSIAGRAPGAVKAGLSVAIGSTTTSNNGGSNGNGGQGANAVDDMQSIFIHVVAVAAHAAGSGWVQLSSTPTLVDLLKLEDSADALGFAHLPAGRITQIRLYIVDDGTNHVVTKEGASAALTVPSGIESGVKLQGPFDLGQCENGLATGIVDLDKSILVHGHGNHDDFILRPTIHHTEFDSVPADICNPAGGGNGSPIPGGGDGTVGGGGSSGGACPPNTEGCTPSSGTTGTGSTSGGNGNGNGNGSASGGGSTSGTGGTGTGDTGTGSTSGTGGAGTGDTSGSTSGTGGTGTGDTSGSTSGTGGTGTGTTSGSTSGSTGTGTTDTSGSTSGTTGTGSTSGSTGSTSGSTGTGSTSGTTSGGNCSNGGAPVFIEGIGLVCT